MMKNENNKTYEWKVRSDAPTPTGLILDSLIGNWHDRLVQWTASLLCGLCLEATLIM